MDGLRTSTSALTLAHEDVRTRLIAHGVTRVTVTQELALEAVMRDEKDVVVAAPTGSGKTLAYVIPIACAIARDGDREGVMAMVITPTRELAGQVMGEMVKYCGEGACAACAGGGDGKAQEEAIRGGARVVVGTPGRIREFIGRKIIALRGVRIQVLDEIDRLLDGGFEGDIEAVMKPPGTCQTLCFSATISVALSRFLERKLVPGYVQIQHFGRDGSNVGGKVEHLSYASKGGDASVGAAVVEAIECYASERVDGRVGGQAIVFTETKVAAERLRATLTNLLSTEFDSGRRERKVASLHGDLPQPARDATLAGLRLGDVDILVATDVAARGLDLPGVELVVHADMPKSADTYSHRAGRAGRPGCAVSGVSLLLPQPDMTSRLADLEREAKISIRRLVYVGERKRVVVTGDLERPKPAASENTDVQRSDSLASERADVRRDDSLVVDQFAMFSSDIAAIAGGKSKSKSKRR